MAVSPATRSPAASDLIVVDGVARPRENSVGRLIHHTEDGIRNFWRWFGDSRVVDEAGRPAVVYHGTRSDVEFTAFDKEHGNPCNSGGHYFSSDRQFAAKFGTVKEFYLRITNPLLDGFNGSGAVMYSSEHRDGGIFTKRNTDHYAKKGTKEYIVFDPAQIKSATHNSGAFSPDSVHFCDNEMPHDAAPTSPAGPPTIMVDGIARPRTNSAGQPIHNTEDGIRNFWRWFGNGATDDRGLPLVLFHGTQSDVAYFDGQRQGETVSKNDIGFFFTNYAREASLYAVGDWWRDDPAPNVMPVYLGFQNPKVLTPDDYESPALWYDDHGRKASLEALAGGHDGLVIRSTRETMVMEDGQQITMFVAFNATDIKSAIGNSGAFVRNSPMISDSEPLQAKPTVSRGMASRLLTLDEALSPEASGPASALLQGPR